MQKKELLPYQIQVEYPVHSMPLTNAHMTTTNINTIDVSFPNKNIARIVIPSDSDNIETINEMLAIPDYKSLILILGGADSIGNDIKSSLTQLFDRGIAKAAIHADALVVDGGTKSGVMQLIGEGLAGRDAKIKLVGIVPESLVKYPTKNANGDSSLVELEPNHSHFVLTSGQQWGDETTILYQLVKGWMHRSNNIPSSKKTAKKTGNTGEKIPCMALITGGGSISKNEVLYAVRKNIPLIVIAGSGGLADEVAKALVEKTTNPADPQIAEIVADGNIQVFHLNNPVNGIERMIIRKLGVDNLLMQTWQSFANFDKNAARQQKTFNLLQKWIIWIGIIGTALVIIHELLNKPTDEKGVQLTLRAAYAVAIGWQQQLTVIALGFIYYILLLVPISLTILLTVSSRFKPGNKWLLLRSGAEAIKREIYKYRVRSGAYANEPEKQLSQAVEDITRRIMHTEVNASAIIPYKGPIPPVMYGAGKSDDGLSALTPDMYVELRLGDQINYFTGKSQKLEKQLKYFSCLAYVTGGVGTFLVAVNFQIWLPLTTAIVTAIATYFGYRRTENTLIKYNQTGEDLKNIRSWWYGLKPEEQADPANINSLVEHTEQVLQSEMDGWVQHMQNALDHLRKASETPEENEKKNGEEKNNTNKKNKEGEEAISDPNKNETLIPGGNVQSN